MTTLTLAQQATLNSRNQLVAAWGSMEEAVAELEADSLHAMAALEFHLSGAQAAREWLEGITTAKLTISNAQAQVEAILGD